MQIIEVPVNNLKKYENNARTHTGEQVDQIKASIVEFGFTNPLLIDEQHTIIAGHGRLEAAQGLGMETVPCITLEGLTEAQKKAYVIADNKLALNAGWDIETLAAELTDLQEADFDLLLTGFSEVELENLLGFGPEIEDGFPELGDGEKPPFEQMTFTVHDEQAEAIRGAILKAKTKPEIDTGLNENSNGNAISYICEAWLNGQG